MIYVVLYIVNQRYDFIMKTLISKFFMHSVFNSLQCIYNVIVKTYPAAKEARTLVTFKLIENKIC